MLLPAAPTQPSTIARFSRVSESRYKTGHPLHSPNNSNNTSMDRLDDDLAMLHAERAVIENDRKSEDIVRRSESHSLLRPRSHREPIDEFDVATNPVHEQQIYRSPEHPSTAFAKFFKSIHNSSFIVRYFTYIIPLGVVLLAPLLCGILINRDLHVGGVELEWFSIWLEIVWLTLWAGRVSPIYI